MVLVTQVLCWYAVCVVWCGRACGVGFNRDCVCWMCGMSCCDSVGYVCGIVGGAVLDVYGVRVSV